MKVIGRTLVTVVALLGWAFVPVPPPLLGTALPGFDLPCDGTLLTAEPDVPDPHFRGAEILICLHDESGASGVRLDADGPLATDQDVIVYRSDGLRWTSRDVERPFPRAGWALPARVDTEDLVGRFHGYAGWGVGQLEAEVEQGWWWVEGSM